MSLLPKFFNSIKVATLIIAMSATMGCQHNTVDHKTQADSLVPESIVSKHLDGYSDVDKEKIFQDLAVIRDKLIYEAKPISAQSIYIGTAGGPGSGKTTVLETVLKEYPGVVYIDPDMRGLKFMTYTYLQDLNSHNISSAKTYDDLLLQGYEKWRGGSNYIANTILNEAVNSRLPIAHGTTATAPIMGQFYGKLKEKGYKIVLLLCASTDNNRRDALHHRAYEQKFYQATPQDFVQKGQVFYERLPIYAEYGDEVRLYWTERFNKGAVEVAVYTPATGLSISNRAGFDRFENAYNHYRKEHEGKKLPSIRDLFIKKV